MAKKIVIVGCGISSAALANVLANKGWEVTIVEKTNFIGGNCYDSINSDGVLIHNYGPHIFHTNNKEIYDFVSKFTTLNGYINKVLVNVNEQVFPLPINFESIRIIMKDKSKLLIDKLQKLFPNKKTITFFELNNVKDELVKEFAAYVANNVYFNYSSKMWGKKFSEIDPNTIARVKIVLGEERNYFPDDKYQGLPNKGYTNMIKKMLDHKNIYVMLRTNALKLLNFDGDQILLNNVPLKAPLVYCGPLDEALKYEYGVLPYRSLDIKFETLPVQNYQQAAVINYPAHPEMTRITEYKLMTLQSCGPKTTISKEYPGQFDIESDRFNTRFYPIIDDKNTMLYNKYLTYFKKYSNFFALGRLAQYKYYDMDDAIDAAFKLAETLEKNY